MQIKNYQPKTRISWIDSLKGLLLVLICFSHFGYLPSVLKILVSPTGTIWVPAFFFLSGLLYSSNKYKSFNEYLTSKIKTLLIPYLFFFSIMSVVDWNLYISSRSFMKETFELFMLGNGPMKASPLWFVNRLFFASIIYYLFERHIKSKYLRLSLIFTLFLFCYIYFKQNVIIFSLNIVSTSLVFIAIANTFKKDIMKFIGQIATKKTLIVILLILTSILSFLLFNSLKDAVMSQNRLNNVFIFFGSSFIGISSLILLFSLILNKLNGNILFRILQYISQNGIIILATHVYIIIIVEQVFKVLHINNLLLLFFTKLFLICFLTYLIIVPLINLKLFFILNRGKKGYKESLKLN